MLIKTYLLIVVVILFFVKLMFEVRQAGKARQHLYSFWYLATSPLPLKHYLMIQIIYFQL